MKVELDKQTSNDELTLEIFNKKIKKLFRQLDERNRKRNEKAYQNKCKEFIALIDLAKTTDWFIMPGKHTRIYKIYHDIWN